MHDIDLIDDSFSKKQSHTYQLSIQTGMSGLSFTILDLNKLKYIVLRHYPFEGLENNDEIANYVSVIYKQDDLLKLSYKTICHEFIGCNSTLIPESEFDESLVNNYLYVSNCNAVNQVINYHAVSSGILFNVFSYPALLHAELQKYFPGIKLFYHTSPFIEYLTSKTSANLDAQVYLYITEGLLNIGITKSTDLLFFNSFNYKEKSDIVYYVLSVLDNYKLSPLNTDVFISADVSNHDEIFDFLNNYLGQIKFIRPSQQFSYSYLFDELYLTRFTNLFNLALCE